MAFRKAVKNPNRRKKEVENWWAVESQDLEFTKSKKGDDMIVLNLGLEDAAEEEYGINIYWLPFHKHQFPRTAWDNWRRDMKEATGFEIPSNSMDAIWASAGPDGDKWPMPYRVGVCEDWREYTDETGLNRRVRNLEVLEWDYVGNGQEDAPVADQSASEVPAASTAPTPDEQEAFWQFCKSAPEQLKDQVRTICANNRITPATLKAGDITVSKLNDVGETIAELIEKERQAESEQQLPDTEEGLPF